MTIKELRLTKRITQKQVSEYCNVTTEYLSMIERGARNPSDKIKECLATLYEVNISQIFLALKETQSFKKEG